MKTKTATSRVFKAKVITTDKIQLLKNHKLIQEMVGIDDLQYKMNIYDSGVYFVETLFQGDLKLANTVLYSKDFWSFWRSEFNNWEDVLIFEMNQAQFTMDLQYYEEDIQRFIMDPITYEGFKNYLKLFHNVRL